jgi:Rha family phage regulatory protein
MTDLSKVRDGMSSLEIAELTGKKHAHVMRDIRSLLEQGVAQSNFGLGLYSDANGQKRPCYNLTPKGCLILASGYDAVLREKIINRLEELEAEKRNGGYKVPGSFKEALLLAAQQQEQIEEQQRQIEQKQATIEAQTTELKKQAPKVEYYDNTLQSVNTLTATQVAKERGMDAEKLNRKLKDAGIIYRQSGQWIVKQPYASWGLHKTRTQTYTRSDGSLGTNTYLVWTQKGKMFILALIDNGYNVKSAIRQIKGEQVSA